MELETAGAVAGSLFMNRSKEGRNQSSGRELWMSLLYVHRSWVALGNRNSIQADME